MFLREILFLPTRYMSERVYNLKNLAKKTYDLGIMTIELEELIKDRKRLLESVERDGITPFTKHAKAMMECMVESKELEMKRCSIEIEYLNSKLK
jgi:hypothetical protein